ncbi:MAG: carboxyl transferase domain-containing protein [Minwuia sp.]|nr:carboxyl transferase domain-containing protein [Minwuia sp.]
MKDTESLNDSNSADADKSDDLRTDIAEVVALRRAALDDARPAAVAKRRKTGHRTARENIDDFLDTDSFPEIGRLTKPKLAHMEGPADGLVMGTGTVDGNAVAVMSAGLHGSCWPWRMRRSRS